MIRHLLDVRKYTIEKIEPGIYYVYGDVFAIQIIVTGQLSPEHNLWLYSLTDTLTDLKVTNKLLDEYSKKGKNHLYSAVMQVIIKANKQQFKEEKNMCEALEEIINEIADKRAEILANEKAEILANEKAEILANEKAKKLTNELTEKVKIEARQEGYKQMGVSSIKNLIASLKVTADQAMDLLKIPSAEREIYIKML